MDWLQYLLGVAFAAGGYVFAIIRNGKDIEDIKTAMGKAQKNFSEEITALKREFKEVLTELKGDLQGDIARLERAQQESNKLKERMAVVETSLKSAHKRMGEYHGIKTD